MNCPTLPTPAPPLRSRFGALLLGAVVLARATLPAGASGEWTHYRGSTHDGVYRGPFRTDWNITPPRLLWRKPAQPALSSFTVDAGRAFTQARRTVGGEDREFAIALDAATGRELWSANLDLADYPDGGVGSDDGPRSTPVVSGDRVFVFTSRLRLYALDAATGRVLWLRDFHAEFNATIISWQNAASPLVVGDLVLVNANTGPNRITAVRASDGTTAWRRHDDRMTQATPVLATLAGVPQAIFYTQTGLVSVRPETGDLLWRFAMPYSTSTAASPVVEGDLVYASAAYSSGSGVARIAATPPGSSTLSATQLWKRRSFNMNHWATGIAHEGHLYSIAGQDSTSLRCIRLDRDEERWRTSIIGGGEVGYGSIVKAGDTLLVLAESGEAVLVRPNPAVYEELQRFQAVTGKTWNSPALSDGVLYVRSTTEMAAWEIAKPQPPAPVRVDPPIAGADGRTRVTVRQADGSPIPAARAPGISLFSTDDPTLPSAQWQAVPATPRLVDGVVVLEDTPPAGAARRFYRTREGGSR